MSEQTRSGGLEAIPRRPPETRRAIRAERDPDETAAARTDKGRDYGGPSGRTTDPWHDDGEPSRHERLTLLLGELTGEVADCRGRGVAERTVCRRLAESSLYEFAWVGDPGLDTNRVTARTVADADGAVDEDERTTRRVAGESGQRPWNRAIRTGDVQVADAANLGPGWPESDDEPDEGSVAAVPLGTGAAVTGVLVVHAADTERVGECERAGLRALGTALATRIDAIRSRQRATAETAVELELRLTDRRSPLVSASAALDCEISLAGHVDAGERRLLYWDVDAGGGDGDGDAESLVEHLANESDIEHRRTLVERPDGCRVELAAVGRSLPDRVEAAGAGLASAVADGGVCRVTVHAPRSVDVRGTVERLRGTYPDLRVLSCRDLDRPMANPTAADGVLDGVTDRQREVLEAAHSSGYFEWPRETTGEELADSLDLSAPTVQGHIRKAEQSILATVFGD